MKALDYLITRKQYNDSPVNKGGVFLPPLGVLRNFRVVNPQQPTEAELDQIFKMYWQSAFDDINAFNSDRPLSVLQFIDLQNEKADHVLVDATILQVNELLKNGLTELKNSDQASTGAFTSTVTPNTRIISPDQLSQDVEDKLQEIDYREWRVEIDGDDITVVLRGERLLSAKTANKFALSSLVFEGLDNQDLTFLGKGKIIELINSTKASSRAFRGTWNAPNVQSVDTIDNVFKNGGLSLTDGKTILKPDNTELGDTILVTVTSVATFLPEEFVFDGVKWVEITNNNKETADITGIKLRLDAIETQLTTTAQTATDNKQAIAANKAASDLKETEQDTKIQANKVQIANEKAERQLNTASRIIFENEKATYVRIEDLPGNLTVTEKFNPTIAAVESNNEIIFTFPQALTQFVDNNMVTWKLIDKGAGQNAPSIEIRDSHNDGSTTGQAINVNGDEVAVKVIGTNQTLTIQDLTVAERKYIVDNYVLENGIQLKGSNTGTVDQIARTNAEQANNKALQAINDAKKKVNKQITQGGAGTGADFETFAQLKALISDDELIAITFATGATITGRIVETGTANANDPIIISGFYAENQTFKIGSFNISDAFKITGGIDTDAAYESKSYDFTGVDTPFTKIDVNNPGGAVGRGQSITVPAAEKAPIGTNIKIIPKVTAVDANELPQDGDQIFYGANLLWINQANKDIMSWSEIKAHVNDGEIMVITKLSDGNYQLVRWELPTDSSIFDFTGIEKANLLYGELIKIKTGSVIKIKRKRGNHIYLGILSVKGNGKMDPNDPAPVDYIGVTIVNGADQMFIGSIKIPNRDEDWDTHYTFGDVYLFQNTSGNINFGYKNGGWIRIGESATGAIDIGSTLWAAADGNGKLIHGNKSATFEEIIDKSTSTWTELVGDEITNFNDETKTRVRITYDSPFVNGIVKIFNIEKNGNFQATSKTLLDAPSVLFCFYNFHTNTYKEATIGFATTITETITPTKVEVI